MLGPHKEGVRTATSHEVSILYELQHSEMVDQINNLLAEREKNKFYLS